MLFKNTIMGTINVIGKNAVMWEIFAKCRAAQLLFQRLI